jgi:hypothetical protein
VPQQSSATASLRQSGLACATFAIIGLPEDGPAHAVSSGVLPCALPTPGNVLLVDQNWTGLPPR